MHGSHWSFLLKCSSWSSSRRKPLYHDDIEKCLKVVWALQTCWGQEFMCCLSSTMVIEKKHHRWQELHSWRLPTLWTVLMVHPASNAKCTMLLPCWQSSLRMAKTTTSHKMSKLKKEFSHTSTTRSRPIVTCSTNPPSITLTCDTAPSWELWSTSCALTLSVPLAAHCLDPTR